MSAPDHSDRRDGIAIIGMACRLPGADTPRAFWDNLLAGRESISFFSDRELLAAGVSSELLSRPNYVKAAPVLNGVDQFDAGFFGYSAKEATWTDPQQRLFLEVAWSALEDAGYHPEGMTQPTGVFAGTGGSVSSYLAAHPGLNGPTGSLQHIGNDKDFLSTRVSFKLDLKGPSINVQTACSTSLVALHLACRSLVDGECDVALAGASTVRVPHVSGHLYEKADILSPDGHCRPFDEKAQGTLFGSGVAVVVVKRLSDAIKAGDQIYAVIRGTAVNNDGGQKVSYTASSVIGQSRAIVEAMAMAGVSPDTIGYVEAHGTGTAVGDPLEIQALSRAFATGTQRKGFCAVGSVKSNIGHLEQAAGMASVIKAALMLTHRKIPASLHYEKPNPKIDFANSPFFVNTQLTDWTAERGPLRLGINGLGLGGTNAFAVLEEAPEMPRPTAVFERPLHTLSLSAKTQPALAAQAERFAKHVAAALSAALADICFTANVSRTQFPVRLAVTASTPEEMSERLARAASGEIGTGISVGDGRARPVVFLFTGQGAQYGRMALELYETQPVVREVLNRCDALARPLLGCSLLEVMFADDGSALDETRFTQPALFAIEYALATLWSSWGVTPAMLMGHSVGEIAAAAFAGALRLEDAIALIAHRGRLMNGLPRTGGMAAVFASAGVVQDAIAAFRDQLSIAAINSPQNTVISGDRHALDQVLAELRARQIETVPLPVSHAFHSPLMAPILDELAAVARGIAFRKPDIALVANLTGELFVSAPTAEYWRAHAREAVQFARGMQTVHELGDPVFLEIGPGSSLLGLGRQCLPDANTMWLPSIRRQKSDWDVMMESVRALYTSGQKIDWIGFDQAYPRRRVSVPTYAFQRRSYWVTGGSARANAANDGPSLLGRRLRSAAKAVQFESFYSLERLPYLDHHRIYGMPVLPTTAGLEAISAGAREHFASPDVALEGLVYREAMVLPEDGARIVQLVLSPEDGDSVPFQLLSTSPDTEDWRLHMTGAVRRVDRAMASAMVAEPGSLDQIKARCTGAIPIDRYYPAIHKLGLEYGASFRGIQELWQGDGEALSRVRIPDHLSKDSYSVHPAFLDACLHIYPALAAIYGDFTITPDELRKTFLPISVERYTIARPRPTEAWAHAVRRPDSGDPDTLVVDIRVYGEAGELIVALEGLALRPLTPEALQPAVAGRLAEHLHQLRWDEIPELPARALNGTAMRSSWLILADRQGVGAELAECFTQLGDHCELVYQDQSTSGLRPAPARRGISAKEPALFHRMIRGYFARADIDYRGVIYLWALDAQVPMESLTLDQLRASEDSVSGSLLLLMQSLAVVRSVTGAAPQLWVVTRNAQSAGAKPAAVNPLQAPAWALGRSLALRYPQLWGGLVDLDGFSSTSLRGDAEALVGELLHAGEEDHVALRNGKRHTLRLVRSDQREVRGDRSLFRPDACYLITGGLGNRGLAMARWLVEHSGVRHLALADLREVQGPAAQAIRELEARGARISTFQVDVTRDDQVQTLIEVLRARLPELRGVLHLASSKDDDVLDLIDWEAFTRVTAARAHGAWLLHKYTAVLELDQFLLFSSPVSLTGSVEQAHVGAADGFLEGLAAYRRSCALPAAVVGSGPWEGEEPDGGAGTGFRQLSMTDIGALLELALHARAPHAMLASVDWPDFLKQQFKNGAPPLFSELAKGAAPRRKPKGQREDPQLLRARIQLAAEHERRAVIIDVVRSKVMESLGMDEEVDTHTALNEFGLDSLIMVDLIRRLEPALGVPVPVAKLAGSPSIEGLVDSLFTNLPRPRPNLELAR